MVDENELCHHGVKGMSWGVRRNFKKEYKAKDKKTIKNYKEQKKYIKQIKKHSTDKNRRQNYKDQKAFIKLMRDQAFMENQRDYYKKAFDPKKLSLGQKLVDSVVLGSANVGYRYATVANPRASEGKRFAAAMFAGPFADALVRERKK